ncbi:hypothetical protein A2115_00785 [Candidatus Woesebacteria bacterium GWA1_41_8]|uniref:Uncharacterized protein n=1 Tax=Candidatus Woesebacteria bacterium GWA1_41_8 TaxID=1802471 RepID=A0A1F7WKG1_9BACT|nr:MAG: hypothetical protein A2115_00785 [Candidatus Woesebacteria bacterium GWA1_41_8]
MTAVWQRPDGFSKVTDASGRSRIVPTAQLCIPLGAIVTGPEGPIQDGKSVGRQLPVENLRGQRTPEGGRTHAYED